MLYENFCYMENVNKAYFQKKIGDANFIVTIKYKFQTYLSKTYIIYKVSDLYIRNY